MRLSRLRLPLLRLPLLRLSLLRPLPARIGRRAIALLALSRFALQFVDRALQLTELIAELPRPRQLIGHALGLAIGGTRSLAKLAGDAVERAGEFPRGVAL